MMEGNKKFIISMMTTFNIREEKEHDRVKQ